MTDRTVFAIAVATLLAVLAVAVGWEFAVEGWIKSAISSLSPVEDDASRWSYVFTAIGFAGMATMIFSVISLKVIGEREQANVLRCESEDRIRQFAEVASDWLWETDENHRYSYFSSSVGIHHPDMSTRGLGKTRFELRHPDDTDDKNWRAHRADLEARRPFKGFEFRIQGADGSIRYNRVRGRPVFGADGLFTGYRGAATDVTKRKEAELALRQSEQEFRALLDSAPDAMVILGFDGLIVHANSQTEVLFGYTQDEIIGTPVERLVPDSIRASHPELCRSFFGKSGRRTMGEGKDLNARRKDGTEIPVEISLSGIQVGGRMLVAAAVRDVTERKAAQQRIEFLARHDVLTELPNRALFEDRLNIALAQATRSGARVALLMIDLDGFKAINDTLGHSAGDAVLIEVAMRLRACIRPGDTIARLGGDEFVIIIPDSKRAAAADLVAVRVLETLAAPIRLETETRSITCSIGIAVHPDSAADREALLRHADAAMYMAKQGGRNQYQFYSPETATTES
jgi:diguanylate cyclase (GGDEF)-like protein/PAS domain S-box-containing protein